MSILKKCVVPECDALANAARGFCNKHYSRWRRHKDVNKSTYSTTNQEVVNLAINNTTDNNCIIFPGGKDVDGYGIHNVNGKSVKAHRYVLSKVTELPYTNIQLCLHKPEVCHLPSCINPLHLRWGNSQENSDDKKLDGTRPLGIKHSNAKLSDDEVREIRIAKGTLQSIANKYGVTKSYVGNIKHKRSRAEVTNFIIEQRKSNNQEN